jgi:lipopolysaccharide/colanic/teichoic acid biosynthesis glycosyltransferase
MPPVGGLESRVMGGLYEPTKRVLDVIAAAAGLVAVGWAIGLIYLVVRLTSRGPGFFIQQRAGRNGRPFPLVKFRTMRTDHVHDPDPSIVITDADPAVTPLGGGLRRFKLDELPQLFNVLAGQMSIVGPRPTVPEQVAEYGPFEHQRLTVPPGITGLAQINGGTALTWPERIEWDVWYVHHRSLGLDLRIFLATFAAMFRGTESRPRRVREVHPDWRPPEELADTQ